MSRQVSWFSELWPGSSFHWADLQHHPPPLAVTLGVGVHLGVVQGSSLISHRPRKPPLHQTWSWAQRDAPSGSWTLCKDLPELLTEAGSWKNTKKLKCFFPLQQFQFYIPSLRPLFVSPLSPLGCGKQCPSTLVHVRRRPRWVHGLSRYFEIILNTKC